MLTPSCSPRWWWITWAAAVLTLVSHGWADTGVSRAEQLFREGVKAAEQGDHATACAKFAQSLELVSRASTMLNLAQCEADRGQLAGGLKRYRAAVALLPPGDKRLAEATRRMEALSKRVPRVTIELEDAPATARILLDDVEIERSKSEMVPVDPGEHTLLLAVAGYEDASARVHVAEGERKTVTLRPGAEVQVRVDPPAEGAGRDPTLTIAGFTLVGIGFAGAVAAAVTGGLILANDGAIDEDCPDRQCTQEGLDKIDENEGLIIGNYVAWAVAIAGAGVGATLLIVDAMGDEEGAEIEVSLVPAAGGGTLLVRTRF